MSYSGHSQRVTMAALVAALALSTGCSNTNVLYETVTLPHGPVELQTHVTAAARLTGDKLLLVAQGETWYRTYYAPPPGPRFSGYVGFGHGRRFGGYGGGGAYDDFDDYPPRWGRRPYWDEPPYSPYEYYTAYLYEVFLTVSVESFPEPGAKGAKVDLFPRQVSVTFGEFLTPSALARTELVVESARAYWENGKPVIEFQASSLPVRAAPPPSDTAGALKGRTTVTVIQAPIYVRGKFKGDLSAKSWAIVADRFRQRGVATLMNLPAQ